MQHGDTERGVGEREREREVGEQPLLRVRLVVSISQTFVPSIQALSIPTSILLLDPRT